MGKYCLSNCRLERQSEEEEEILTAYPSPMAHQETNRFSDGLIVLS